MPTKNNGRSRLEIERRIADITAAMKGPLPNWVRYDMHAERKELRDLLYLVKLEEEVGDAP